MSPGSAQPDPLRTLLTVPEACHSLRVSRWTLYRLIQSGQLDTVKIGTARRVPVAAIQKLVEALQVSEAQRL
jgi:excisionase family DNA binding protein